MEADPMSLPAAARNMSNAPASAGAAASVAALSAAAVSLESALARAQSGELAAFRELIRAHQDIVYTLALRMLKVPEDAEELAQDVFVSVHQHLGKIASATHLLFWLRRTVCHRAIDRLRRRPAHLVVPLDSVEEMPLADAGRDRDPLLERRLRDLVSRLPPMARAVVLLKFQEDLDPLEIAATLGMPLNTVKSHLRRSLASLRAGCEGLRPISEGGQS